MDATPKVKSVELALIVTRADGSRVDLGTVSDSRWWWNHGPARLFAKHRINRANRALAKGEGGVSSRRPWS